jgi:hypothetical protein
MARPKRENRDDVAGTTLTIRITEPERVALDALVARRVQQLDAYGGAVSAASVVRALIRQAVQAEGLVPQQAQVALPQAPAALPAVPPAPSAAPKATPSNGKATPKPKAALDGDSLRTRFVAARDAGKAGNRDVADVCGFADGSSVSRWAAGKGTLAEGHWSAVDKLLRPLGF